jgi:hypothetical protein
MSAPAGRESGASQVVHVPAVIERLPKAPGQLAPASA